MHNEKFPYLTMLLFFVLSLVIIGSARADVSSPRALSVGETYVIEVDAFTGNEGTTEPKTDAHDGLDGDNIYFQRYNVARAFAGLYQYWYSSTLWGPGEPDPAGPQWVDYKPPLVIIGQGTYTIEGQYRYTENRATYNVPYTVHHEGGTTTIYQNQHIGSDNNYYSIDLGTHNLGEDGWVHVEDPGIGSITFNRMRFTYQGSPVGIPVADIDADPERGYAPLTVSFDASGSSDSGGTIVSYEWDFTNDGTYDENNSFATTSHTYTNTGAYQCRLRVTDNEGNTDSAIVEIAATDGLDGDADGDGDVDMLDLGALAEHFVISSGMTWSNGDFDLDGDVDFYDYAILANNWLAKNLDIYNLSPDDYHVVYDGLYVGELQYADRAYTFINVPSLVEGKTYIKTANDDKLATGDSFLTFDVNVDVIVYVAHDDRLTSKPTWLTTNFTDTGEHITSIDSSSYFSLYLKEFAAGTVTLGGNYGNSSSSMYSVVVAEQ